MTEDEAHVDRLLAELAALRLDYDLLKAEHASCETLEFELKVTRKELEECKAKTVVTRDCFRIHNRSLIVDFWYPRTEDRPNEVIVGLVDVRFAQDIRIRYEFDRGGWLIEVVSAEDDDGQCTWAEAAFVAEQAHE